MKCLLLCLLSGVLLTLCFEPVAWGGLVWVWMLPFLWALWTVKEPVVEEGKRKRFRGLKWRGFGLGYAAGLVFWLINLKWIAEASGLGSIVLAVYLSVYFGLFGVFAVKWGNPWRGREGSAVEMKASWRTLGYAVICALAWVALEWLRGWVMTGFGWNGLGVAFAETLVMAQAADVLGVTGLAFAPVFISAMVVQVMRRLWVGVQDGKMIRHWDFGVSVMVLGCFFVYGVYCLTFVPKRAGEEMRVVLIQENISQDLKWEEGKADEIYAGYAEATGGAMRALEEQAKAALEKDGSVELPWPDLVIWPESGLPEPIWFDEEGKHFQGQRNENYLMGEVLNLGEFPLLLGSNVLTADRSSGMMSKAVPAYNCAVLVDGEKGFEGLEIYRKVHLVLFGEKIPLVEEVPLLQAIFKFSSGVEYAGNFGAGESLEPMEFSLKGERVTLIPSVCFEDTVGRLTRKFVRNEPQVIVNLTNDGWFKESEGAAQHFANAKFRAIELRRPMIRAANTGVSVILQATGSEYTPNGIKQSQRRQIVMDDAGNHFTRGWIEGGLIVPKEAAFSLYALWGDWFSYVALVLSAGWIFMARRKS